VRVGVRVRPTLAARLFAAAACLRGLHLAGAAEWFAGAAEWFSPASSVLQESGGSSRTLRLLAGRECVTVVAARTPESARAGLKPQRYEIDLYKMYTGGVTTREALQYIMRTCGPTSGPARKTWTSAPPRVCSRSTAATTTHRSTFPQAPQLPWGWTCTSLRAPRYK